uniref:Inactive rhomboid protein n=1 Tax=Petromyzon marinus TaxID=7757 RepID=S4RSJ0_PETMA
ISSVRHPSITVLPRNEPMVFVRSILTCIPNSARSSTFLKKISQHLNRLGYGQSPGLPLAPSKIFPGLYEFPHPYYQRPPSIGQRIQSGLAEWFGLAQESEAWQQWQRRGLRHCDRRLGKLKAQFRKEMDLHNHDSISLASAETPPPFFVGMQKVYDPLARGRAFRVADDMDSVSVPPTPVSPGAISLASMGSYRSGYSGRGVTPGRTRDSGPKLSLKAAAALLRVRLWESGPPRRERKRSGRPQGFISIRFIQTSDRNAVSFEFRRGGVGGGEDRPYPGEPKDAQNTADYSVDRGSALTGSALDPVTGQVENRHPPPPMERGWRKQRESLEPKVPLRQEVVSVGRPRGQRITPVVRSLVLQDLRPTTGHGDAHGHGYGTGLLGRIAGHASVRRSGSFTSREHEERHHEMEDFEDHRAYFTYWVTFVHVLITVLTVTIYGLAPIGFTQQQTSATILRSKGSYEDVIYDQRQNFWIGPSSEALAHLGAKFVPCMRPDAALGETLARQRAQEALTGCCVRNDGSGCVQTTGDECSKTLENWIKWPESSLLLMEDKRPRTSGAVCGQDPRVCEEPASSLPHEWPDNITEWPICVKKSAGNHTQLPHMDCEVTGRPCCLGTQGRCELTTREHCDFMRGYFHDEASLCSQVTCMQDACGLLPFLSPEAPDQIYRLWLSLFLHAGILHCLVSSALHLTVLRDLEKLAGSLRVLVVYVTSGVTGSIASAVLLPHNAEVGPAGSLGGILACYLVELLQSWRLMARPCVALAKIAALAALLLLLGLLPWVDNVAHVLGFVSALPLAYAVLPYVGWSMSPALRYTHFHNRRRPWKVALALTAALALPAGLAALFYLYPVHCRWCEYFNCAPFSANFCANPELWPLGG